MKKRKCNILLIVVLVIASLVMASLPHHHHQEQLCFERIECEQDHAINDEHTHHAPSDDSHPDNCITHFSFLPQYLLKFVACFLGVSLFLLGGVFFFKKMNLWRLQQIIYSISFTFPPLPQGYFSLKAGRAPPVFLC